MDEQRKRAYRYLLYMAMLDIRPIRWIPFSFRTLLTPLQRKRSKTSIHRAGTIADLMHNLAMFSAYDFEQFDEAWFWREFDSYQQNYPKFELTRYKNRFEKIINEGASAENPFG
jgi:hypothetical protein